MLLCSLVASVASVNAPAAAQEAVVLSGGGSRGLAHAGALLGLERQGHDPEWVIGVSMGAVIGALYAAGIPPDSIWSLVDRRNWREIFVPLAATVGPEASLRHPILSLDLADGGPARWQGLLPDWRINRLLVRLLFDANVAAGGDFDRLPRRFRAVATDLETGRPVVLRGGDLARAARASMAVPGVFAPVPWEDRVLVDGGIADYLPVELARELGAERVVAVDVVRPPPELLSTGPLQVAERGLDLLLMNAGAGAVSPDLLVLPPIDPSLSMAVFPIDPTPLLRAGLVAALRTLEGGLPAVPAPPTRPRPPTTSLAERLDTLEVEAPTPALETLARHVLSAAGEGAYRPERILAAIDQLYATGFFDGIWPSVLPSGGRGNGGAMLRVVAEPRPALRLLGAAGYDTGSGGRVWGELQRRVSLGLHPGVLSLALSVAEWERWGTMSLRAASLRWAPLLWTAGLYAREVAIPIPSRDPRTEVTRVGGWSGVEWRRIEPEWIALAAWHTETIEARTESGLSTGPRVRITGLPPLMRVAGLTPYVEAEARFGAVAYRRLRAQGFAGLGVGRVRLAATGHAAWVDGSAPADVLPALGSGDGVPGLRWGIARGRRLVVVGADLAHPVPRAVTLRLRSRAGMVLGLPDRSGDPEWAAGVEAAALGWTPVGPVEAGVGISTRGSWRLELNIGPRF